MDLLATSEDLRAWMQDPDIDEATATVVLAAASGHVRGAVGQDLSLTWGDTVVLDGVAEQWLSLPQRPVIAVTAVTINGATVPSADWTLSGSRLYRWAGWNRVLVMTASTSYGRAPTLVAVTYDHGYPEIPDDIKGATLAMAADILANPTGLLSENIDDYTWRRSDTTTGTAAGMLLRDVVRRYGVRARSVRLAP